MSLRKFDPAMALAAFNGEAASFDVKFEGAGANRFIDLSVGEHKVLIDTDRFDFRLSVEPEEELLLTVAWERGSAGLSVSSDPKDPDGGPDLSFWFDDGGSTDLLF